MPTLKIYTRSGCPYCVRALSLLRSAGIESFEEISIDGQEAPMRRQIMELTGGRWDVPQVFVDDLYVGDDDALAALVQSGELAKLLSVNE